MSSKKIHWHALTGNLVNCNVDKNAKVFSYYNLSNVSVGKGTYIQYNAMISNTTIGKFCSIGPNLMCGWGIHPVNGISTASAFYSTDKTAGFTYSRFNKCVERKLIQIGNDVFIGMNVTILDGVKIGDGAVIGAGAVVNKDIPPYAIAVGCPIRIVKYRFSQEIIDGLLASEWWDREEEILLEVEKNFFEVEKFLSLIKNRLK